MNEWDRRLWGVMFESGVKGGTGPTLIGNVWAAELCGDPYPGEPTRALLFCTRGQARTWCADTMRKWRDGRQIDLCLRRWRVQPVRVREIVMPEKGKT